MDGKSIIRKPNVRQKAVSGPNRGKSRTKPAPQPSQDLFTRLCSGYVHQPVEKEFRFHPTRKWRFDYAIPSHKIAIEIEGGVWTAGRHVSPKGFLGDIEKYNAAAVMGWRLLRFVPDDMYKGATFDTIRAAMDAAVFLDGPKND